jgi:hypothetical protein
MIFSVDMIINDCKNTVSDSFMKQIKKDYIESGYSSCHYFEIDNCGIFCPVGMN